MPDSLTTRPLGNSLVTLFCHRDLVKVFNQLRQESSLLFPLCPLGQRSVYRETSGDTLTTFFFFFFCFIGPHSWHVEVPRLGVKSELQPLAYTTAAAKEDLSHVCDLHHSSRQHQILNPRSKARDQTLFLMDTSWIRLPCATRETPYTDILTELGPERAGEERTS